MNSGVSANRPDGSLWTQIDASSASFEFSTNFYDSKLAETHAYSTGALVVMIVAAVARPAPGARCVSGVIATLPHTPAGVNRYIHAMM
jgi:hypothetical protein